MPPRNSSNNSEPGRLAPGARRLLLCVIALTFCWLIILPHLARTPAVRTMIDRNEALGINPSAKFYSELPGLPRVNHRVEAIVAQNPQAFWRASSAKDPRDDSE